MLLEHIHTENKQNQLVNNSVSMLLQHLKMSTIYNPVLPSICVFSGYFLRQLIFFPTYYR